MKTQSNSPILPYEVSGMELRIHWNIEEKTKDGTDGKPYSYWEADEALCGKFDDRSTLIEAIIATEYSTGRELATINNQATDPEAYAEYQTFRAQAKALADGWLSVRA
jgi:hypothetical protein